MNGGKVLNSKLVQFLLLLSIFFNITHASLIAIEDDCHHETAQEYVMEQTQASDCGDLCEMHHLFHWTAIIVPATNYLGAELYAEQPNFKELSYYPPFQRRENKPPIA